MTSTLCLFLLIHLTNSLDLNFHNNTPSGPEDPEILEKVQGNILCRSCGNEVASSNDLISKFSPHSQYSFRDSLFDKDEVLVQVFVGNFFINYPIVATSASNCVGVEEWVEDGSWYPGYRWKPCVCPDCGEFIGWIFERLDSDSHFVQTPNTLFGLILTSLIGESFANSLTVIPGGLSN